MAENPGDWSSVAESDGTNEESGFLDGITAEYEKISSFSVEDFKSLPKEDNNEEDDEHCIHINCIEHDLGQLSIRELHSLPCYEQDDIEENELAVMYLFEMKSFIHMFNYAFSVLHYSLMDDCEDGRRPDDISMESNFFLRCGNQFRNFLSNCHRMDDSHYPWNILENTDIISNKVKICNELLNEQTTQLEDGSYPNWKDLDLGFWQSRTKLILAIDEYLLKVVGDLRRRPGFDMSRLGGFKPNPTMRLMYKVDPSNVPTLHCG